MATYNKKLKTLEIHLMLDGANPITIVDTADDNKATRALNEFKKYGTMHYERVLGGDKVINAIPYEAVQYIKVTEVDASVNKADPYGCEGGSDGKRELIGESGKGSSCEDFALFVDTVVNFDQYKVTFVTADEETLEAIETYTPSTPREEPCVGYGFSFGEARDADEAFVNYDNGVLLYTSRAGKIYREAK